MTSSRLASGSQASCSWQSGQQPCCPARPATRPQQRRQSSSRPLAASSAACRRAASSGSSGALHGRGRLAVAAAAEAEAGALVPDRQGYRSFLLECCEFLVAETPDGRLNLSDIYVTTDVPETGSGSGFEDPAQQRAAPSYRRPEGLEAAGPLPAPRAFHAVPWYTYWPGDVVQEREPVAWTWRYYLVPVLAHEPSLQLSFDEGVFMLDAKSATLQRCEVHRLAPAGTPPEDLRLRIRDDVITVDTLESLPEWEQVVKVRQSGAPALSTLEAERLQQYLDALEEARKQGTIDEVEFETAYDVHWLAGMQAGSAGVEALGAQWEMSSAAAAAGEGQYVAEAEEDVMGGWDSEMFEDLMQDYDEEGEEAEEFEGEFDSPATDF